MNESNELILVNPNNDQAIIDKMRNMVEAAHKDAVARIEAATEALADGINGAKKSAFDKDVKFFTDGRKKFVDGVLAIFGADKVTVQVDASAAAVNAAVKAYKARWDEAKAACEGPAETHFHAIVIECTDSTWKLLDAYLAKSKGLVIGTQGTIDATDVKRIKDDVDEAAAKRKARIEKARAAIEG